MRTVRDTDSREEMHGWNDETAQMDTKWPEARAWNDRCRGDGKENADSQPNGFDHQ